MSEISTLQKFRNAFHGYLTGVGVNAPAHIKDASELEFVVFVTKYVKPYRNDWEAGFQSLKGFIESYGVHVPELDVEQKNKLVCYLEAFLEILDSPSYHS